MKTIKIIDLLNKIANGEEVPKKIVFDNIEYVFSCGTYYSENVEILWNNYIFAILNEEVEIIEEDSKIEKIEIDNQDRIKALSTDNFVYKVNQPMKNIIYKLNELIDTVNELKEDK